MDSPQSIVDTIQNLITVYGLKILAALVIFFIGRWVAQQVRAIVQRLMKKSNVDDMLVSFVSSLAYIGLMTFVVLAVLSNLGIQTASFIAVLGAAGLAVGLALQGSLANFAAGVLLIIFKPFKVGDFIDAAGVAGIVEEITIFTTKMRSPDNKAIIVPNAKLTGDNITNFSAKDTRRVDLVIGVSYSDDLGKVKSVLEDILGADERILKDPEPTIGVLELGDSSVNFVVRPWVSTADYWNVYFDTLRTVKERFDAENISIPFPQRDVHLVKGEGAA